jgi:hypothetical protein
METIHTNSVPELRSQKQEDKHLFLNHHQNNLNNKSKNNKNNKSYYDYNPIQILSNHKYYEHYLLLTIIINEYR